MAMALSPGYPAVAGFLLPPRFDRADLLPNYLSQRLIDPVLPARSGFLKVIKNVPVNSQGDKLLGIGAFWPHSFSL
jgi:hypothetical protein